MKDSLLTKIIFLFLFLVLIGGPFQLQAVEIDSAIQETEPVEITKVPTQMTQKEMNDLLGEDPYLGQTSYLQSPDGFSQRKKP